jgi:hypothetical protein
MCQSFSWLGKRDLFQLLDSPVEVNIPEVCKLLDEPDADEVHPFPSQTLSED